MRPVLPAVALSLLLLPVAAHAARGIALQARSTGQLADLCGAPANDPQNDAKVDFCHGFAQGAVDVILHDAGEKKPFCFPRPAPSRSQTLNDFVHWVRADPAHANLPAAEGLSRFLAERYPCR